jgi:hypothetical protein
MPPVRGAMMVTIAVRRGGRYAASAQRFRDLYKTKAVIQPESPDIGVLSHTGYFSLCENSANWRWL